MKSSLFHLCRLVVLTGAIVGGLATAVQARLGETKEQLVERYGEPRSEPKAELSASEGTALFVKDNVEVRVEFKNGKTWMIAYRTHKLTSELEASFREANDGDEGIGDWEEPVEHLGRNYWRTKGGDVTAVSYLAGNSKIFKFCTETCLMALIEERKEQVATAIPGAPSASADAADAPSENEDEPAEEEKKDANPF